MVYFLFGVRNKSARILKNQSLGRDKKDSIPRATFKLVPNGDHYSTCIMSIPFDLNSTNAALLVVTVFAALLTGSSIQWVVDQGGLRLSTLEWKISWEDSNQQYYFIVVVAAIASMIQTVTCFINTLLVAADRPNVWFMTYIVLNWCFMTHASIMLVSLKLSRTFRDSAQAWKRLLWINLGMVPLSLIICVYWVIAHTIQHEILDRAVVILEPLQIALWGLIEFSLSTAFIVKMWKFRWTAVERQGVFVLILVGSCDVATVLLNLLIGDLESTCVKGFVYCLRIRLEISVLHAISEFVRKKTYSRSATELCPPSPHLLMRRSNDNLDREGDEEFDSFQLEDGDRGDALERGNITGDGLDQRKTMLDLRKLLEQNQNVLMTGQARLWNADAPIILAPATAAVAADTDTDDYPSELSAPSRALVAFHMPLDSTPSQRMAWTTSSITLSDVEIMPTLLEEGQDRHDTIDKPKLPDRPPLVPLRSTASLSGSDLSLASTEEDDETEDAENDVDSNLSVVRLPIPSISPPAPAPPTFYRTTSSDSPPSAPKRAKSAVIAADDDSYSNSEKETDTTQSWTAETRDSSNRAKNELDRPRRGSLDKIPLVPSRSSCPAVVVLDLDTDKLCSRTAPIITCPNDEGNIPEEGKVRCTSTTEALTLQRPHSTNAKESRRASWDGPPAVPCRFDSEVEANNDVSA